MFLPDPSPDAASRPACAVVGMGRCVGSVRRAASDAGLITVWFPEMEALMRGPPSSLSLVVFAPSHGWPQAELVASLGGPVATVPSLAVITDGGLARLDASEHSTALETFRFPCERDAFVAAASQVVTGARR